MATTKKTRRWGHVSWEYLEGSKDDPKNAQIEHSRRPSSSMVCPLLSFQLKILYTTIYNRKMEELGE